jgi:TetR/AcrR family transcriptional regulator, cholesterol catabolism regulator
VTNVNSAQPTRSPRNGRPRVEGAKRNEILAAATERFGRDGYEDTKWADIAADVGVGPTALYHYFESKQHCLYVIMDEAIADFRTRFEALTDTTARDPLTALAAVLQDCFDLNDDEVMRNRVLVSEQGLLGISGAPSREEDARVAARSRVRDLESAWVGFLSRAMDLGVVPRRDPQLLARAVLGLYNSVWQWYRPGGLHGLRPVAEFFQDRALAMIGVGADGVIRPRMVA